MDKVKAEPDFVSDTMPAFPSEHELHDMNDEGPVSFDVLQKGAKVRFASYSFSVNHVTLTYMRRNYSICRGSRSLVFRCLS